MAYPIASSRAEISVYKPLHQTAVRNTKIGVFAFALILTAGAIVAPFLGLGVTGCILLGVGAAIFLCSLVAYCNEARQEQNEANRELLEAVEAGNHNGIANALGIGTTSTGLPRWGEGANVNVRNELGQTPLSIAVSHYTAKHSDCWRDDIGGIQSLLRNGARRDQIVWDEGVTKSKKIEVNRSLDQWESELQPLYRPTLADHFFKRCF
ncbi:MAG: hypothetical protein KR126chlam2_01193 [Chlamydiae bacterium]|nr:hypothetical protein [Chlamydiota bacterium]